MPFPFARSTANAPAPRRRRLVYSLLAAFAVVGLVPLGSFAFKLIQTSRRALETSQQEIELQLASSIASEIDSRVEGLVRQVSSISDSLEPRSTSRCAVRRFPDEKQPPRRHARRPALHSRWTGEGIRLTRRHPDAPRPDLLARGTAGRPATRGTRDGGDPGGQTAASPVSW
jgi:hypothetical protein